MAAVFLAHFAKVIAAYKARTSASRPGGAPHVPSHAPSGGSPERTFDSVDCTCWAVNGLWR